MSELKNFPFKNQLNSPTFDGGPDENADMNCVQTCIAAGLQYFTGKEYEPDEVLDAVYGEGYIGGTAAVMDVGYCTLQGVKLSPINGSPTYLVAQAHAQLALGHAVIGTIPSCYCPPQDRLNPGPSHAIIFYKDSAGVLIAMNPWQAISQANTDQWWIDRLCFDQLWSMEKGNMSGIPQGWKDDGVTLVAPNGHRLQHGFRSYVMSQAWHPEDVPLEEEHGDPRGGTAQVFMMERLRYEDKRGVYVEGLGIGTLEMQAQLAQAAQKEAALQSQIEQLKAAPPPPPVLAPQPDILKSLNQLEGQLVGIIDSLSTK